MGVPGGSTPSSAAGSPSGGNSGDENRADGASGAEGGSGPGEAGGSVQKPIPAAIRTQTTATHDLPGMATPNVLDVSTPYAIGGRDCPVRPACRVN